MVTGGGGGGEEGGRGVGLLVGWLVGFLPWVRVLCFGFVLFGFGFVEFLLLLGLRGGGVVLFLVEGWLVGWFLSFYPSFCVVVVLYFYTP